MPKRENQGGVRQRADGRWEGRLSLGKHQKTGKYITRSAYGENEDEAHEKLTELRCMTESLDYVRASGYTVGEWAADWYHIHAEGRVKPNTDGGYRNLIFRHIAPGLAEIPLSDLTEQQVRVFYEGLAQNGLSRRSVWCVHLLLRRILDEACRERLLPANPAASCEVPAMPEREQKRLRTGQVKRYLDAAEALDFLPIAYVGLQSGLRQGELFALSWAAFDVQSRQVILGKHLLALSEKAVEHLVGEHEKHPGNPYVFLDAKTGELYTPHRFYYLHRQILKRAHLPTIGFRDLQLNFKEMEL